MPKKFYVTTAIDYVNAKPHIGHAYEKILADAIARWYRLKGFDVRFLTGTDDNAQKNEQAAKESKIPPLAFVNKNAKHFEKLCKVLNISHNRFIRTIDKDHIKKSQEIFKKVYDKGDIYLGKYKGLYCRGCEAFKTERDLVNGKCPEHNTKPNKLSEEAYFFRLLKYKNQILKLLKNKLVIPETKAKEIIYRLENEELRDLNVSRTNLEWGIDSPINKNFKIYVWFDALINYISGSGKNEEYWPADCHVIGKGINWFHSVIWPAILLSSGYKLPKKILVHGYLTVDGKKISKSLGNIIDPIELSKKYSVDALRYFLIREIPVENDGDFSENALKERYNNELANKLGNLVSRVTSLAEKHGLKKTQNKLLKKLKVKEIERNFDNYHVDRSLSEIFSFIDACNECIQKNKPWETKDAKLIYQLADSIKAIAIVLWPFIPETSEKIASQFNFEIKYENIKKLLEISKVKKGEILFKKI